MMESRDQRVQLALLAPTALALDSQDQSNLESVAMTESQELLAPKVQQEQMALVLNLDLLDNLDLLAMMESQDLLAPKVQQEQMALARSLD